MTIERRLQIGIAAMTALGTTLLGLGQHSSTLPVLALVVAVTSVVLTDIKGWLHFNTTVANLAAIVAIVVAVWQWERLTDDGALLALANLLFYLQCVLLYKRKVERSYWLLALSSLLQAAVASALSIDILFGWLLLAYLIVGLWTMSWFYLYRENRAFAAVEEPAVTPAPIERRWPLAATSSAFAPAPIHDLPRAGIVPEFHRRMIGLFAATLFLAVGAFLVIPRGPRAGGIPQLPGTQHLAGFSPQVTLGELGTIVENPAQVMKVRFVDANTGQPFHLNEPPLLRGSTLIRYDNGNWERTRGDTRFGMVPPPRPLAPSSEVVRQEITIEPLATNILFCVSPAVPTGGARNVVHYMSRTEQVLRPNDSMRQRLSYQMITAALAGHRQATVTPAQRPVTEIELRSLLQLPEPVAGVERLPGLKAQAAQQVASISAGDSLSRALALERYLRLSQRFGYTLDPPVRDAQLDPIEDFMTLHPSGHCEYFASALALMLRSVGIPARLAVGFRGGDFNPVTNRYEVQQLHAHAWVEAYLAPEQVSDAELPASVWGEDAGAWGAWVRLDPTPAADAVNPLTEHLGWYAWYTVRDFVKAVWSEFVLEMDAERQRASIYQPTSDALAGAFAYVTDRNSWRGAVRDAWSSLNPATWKSGQPWRFSVGAVAAVAFVALAAIAALLAAIVFVPKLWHRFRPARIKGRLGRAEVAFYHRFEALLQRHRLVRPAAQTPREFALAVGGQLAESPATQPAAALPRLVADAFYRVRYGGRPLDNREAETLEQALAQLEAVLLGKTAKP